MFTDIGDVHDPNHPVSLDSPTNKGGDGIKGLTSGGLGTLNASVEEASKIVGEPA